MADVQWIKITTDMFENRKIRHLRKLPDGNNIVLIWVMLLTLAGKCNAGGMIFLTENIPYTAKMLADELDFEESTVKLAIQALEQLGMIRTGDYLFIEDWETHQNVDGMEKIKEQNRLRKQRQRAREALPTPQDDMSRDSHVTVTGDVTQCHATDIDIDIDIDNISSCSEHEVQNEQKKTRKASEPISHDHKAYKASVWLSKQIKKRMPKVKEMTEDSLQSWARDIEKLNRIDGYDWETISDVLIFSQEDIFWQNNILSAGKFRKQFVALMAKMEAKNG